MVSKIKIVLLTSNSLRHKYIANKLAEVFDLKLIITESKSLKIEDTSLLNDEDTIFIKQHFESRIKNEKKFFGNYPVFPKHIKLEEVKHGKINSDKVFFKIKAINPDRIILFGTSIIKKTLIDYYHNKIINLHLGLSPYYKGSATNIFPIYYNDVSGVGATIHIATAKVDEGPVLYQFRPVLLGNETIHDIGNKVIKEVGELLPNIIVKHFDSDLLGVVQKEKGIVCRIVDLKTEALREVYKNIENEIVLDYLRNKEKLDLLKPIIDLK